MNNTFSCSLVHNGVLGGGLFADESGVTYKTGKVTVEARDRNLRIPFGEVLRVNWSRVIVPVAEFEMKNGERFKFLIYSKKKFCDVLDTAGVKYE